MKKPVIFVLDGDPQTLKSLRQELEQRYAADYQIIGENNIQKAITRLEELKRLGEEVAIMLAGCFVSEMTGGEFLVRASKVFPQAKRGLLVEWGDQTCSDHMIIEAMALNKIDAFAPKPFRSDNLPVEEFHHFISEFLLEWSREHRPAFTIFRIIGEQWSKRSYELRDLLKRNSVRFLFYAHDSEEGEALLENTGTLDAPLPVVVCYNGQVLINPSNTDLANFVGARTGWEPSASQEKTTVDVVIVGAGPSGLSAAVNSASEGLRTVMVEREALGGQAGMSSRIRNYLGFPTGIAGNELASRAYAQAQLFGVETIFTKEVTELMVRGDERIVVLSDGTEIPSRVVILSMGMAYRRLMIPALEKLIGAGVFYGAVGSEAMALKGKEVAIVGGANSAGQAAVHLSKYVKQVTMVVRSSSLSVNMSEYLIQEIEARDNIRVLFNTEVIDGIGEYRLEALVIQNKETGKNEILPSVALFVMIGARPHTDWLPPAILRDPAGFVLTGEYIPQNGALPKVWSLKRRPLAIETSLPGVFAVGDVRHLSVKRVASAVGEGSMGIQYVHQYLGELEKANGKREA